jgi:hypothetical protein
MKDGVKASFHPSSFILHPFFTPSLTVGLPLSPESLTLVPVLKEQVADEERDDDGGRAERREVVVQVEVEFASFHV